MTDDGTAAGDELDELIHEATKDPVVAAAFDAAEARRKVTATAATPTPEQAKANADAAFAVGALCGALGAVGREVIASKIQRRFEEVIAEQEVTDGT